MTGVNAPHAAARIIVHDYDHAVTVLAAACALDHTVTILSAAGAAQAGGPAWWRELMSQAAAAVPRPKVEWILDCADEPGTALAALREGVPTIALEAESDILLRVAQIAERSGARLVRAERAGALDLAGSNNPQRDCELYLSGPSVGVAKPDGLR